MQIYLLRNVVISILLCILTTVVSPSSLLWSQTPPASQSVAPALPADIPAAAERYSMLLMGNAAGQQAVWTAADGTLHIFFQFNDRGRGPKTTSILKLDDKGIPLSETVTGNDYLKSPVDESFALSDSTARWKNTAEQGEKKVSAPGYYVALNGAPTETALLVNAALVNGGKIALLPEGEARVQRLNELDVTTGSQKKHVTLYAITGLDFAPSYIWVEGPGCPNCRFLQKNHFFASVDEWSTIIPEGWESCAATLLAAQNKVKESRAAELAARLAHHPPHDILFTHANVFDVESLEVLTDRFVLVRGDRIVSVGDRAPAESSEMWSEKTPLQTDRTIIDATNKTLIPGLWDMHAHVGDNDGLLNLAAGVTTVRDLANDTDSLLARRQRIIDGKEIGTRIVLAGIIDGNDAFHGPTKVLVSTEAEARAAVDNYKKLGYVQIKIYSSVPPALVPIIIDEAHKNGMRVSGHIPANMIATQCVEDGYDEIQHMNFLVLNFFPDVKNTNTIARLTKPGELSASLDLNSPQVQSFIKLLQDHHTKLDLTMSVFEDQYRLPPGQIPLGFRPIANRLPAQVRRGLLTAAMTPPAGMEETYKKSYAKMLEFEGLLYRSGLSIEDGTDNMAGFALHRELEIDVEAGIPANVVLQNATLNAAKIMNMDKDLGSIASGKLADLVLIDGDPTKNISDIRRTALVVKDGVIYKPAELYTELGVTP
ncbi:MAG TPA: amidohydrolase family protein [Terriglobales bacterium]|nr:amidohydrolase family protein [Terriglobales bacterium]